LRNHKRGLPILRSLQTYDAQTQKGNRLTYMLPV